MGGTGTGKSSVRSICPKTLQSLRLLCVVHQSPFRQCECKDWRYPWFWDWRSPSHSLSWSRQSSESYHRWYAWVRWFAWRCLRYGYLKNDYKFLTRRVRLYLESLPIVSFTDCNFQDMTKIESSMVSCIYNGYPTHGLVASRAAIWKFFEGFAVRQPSRTLSFWPHSGT